MTEFSEPPVGEHVIRLEVPAAFNFLKLLGPCLQALLEMLAVSDNSDLKSLAYDLELVTYEVCTNIVEHAYGGRGGRITILFSLDNTKKQCTIGITDSGRPFQFSPGEIQLPDAEQTRGYGLYLIDRLVDEIRYWTSDGRNHWRLTKNLQA